MSSIACTVFGTSILALLLAGYLAQHFLPPPKPKVVGIDLGTTFSCVGVYHAVTGQIDVLEDKQGHKCIPSIVAFSQDGVVVGYKAAAQAEHNPARTIYDAKRFIGKHVSRSELDLEAHRYPFQMVADEFGMIRYEVGSQGNDTLVTPEFIGSRILATLRETAESILNVPVTKAVMSVPAEFNEEQRNFTRKAAAMAGLSVLRIINEPTAAAMAYGLHKKDGVSTVIVIDLGGGTLDVSLLRVQGGMFLTQAMAGNNHLGGQDFNHRLLQYVLKQVETTYNRPLDDPEDMQVLRDAVEVAKLNLTSQPSVSIRVKLRSILSRDHTNEPVRTNIKITRQLFENMNMDLLKKILMPIDIVLRSAELERAEVDEIVLVGGSTRIPKVREMIKEYFGKVPNTMVDPELAVTAGVAVQAGILGGMWPLTVSAVELPTRTKKKKVPTATLR